VGGLKRKGSEYSSSEVGGTKVAGRGEVGVAVDTTYSEVCQVCRAILPGSGERERVPVPQTLVGFTSVDNEKRT
jgi:hypothetical protein